MRRCSPWQGTKPFPTACALPWRIWAALKPQNKVKRGTRSDGVLPGESARFHRVGVYFRRIGAADTVPLPYHRGIAYCLHLSTAVSKPQRWALLLSYTGILLIVSDSPDGAYPNIVVSIVLVFASAVIFALFTTASGHFIPRFGSRRFTAYTMSVACVATGVHFAASKPMERLVVSSDVFGLALLLALFSTVAPAFLMNAGIHRIGVGQASIISTIGPVATLAMANGLLGESLGPFQLIGSTMVLSGVLLVSLAKCKPRSNRVPSHKQR